MPSFDERMAEKLDRFMQRQSQKLSEFSQSRGAEVTLKAIGKLVAVGVTIYVIWHEFPDLSEHVNFLLLLMTWGLYGVIIFVLDIRQSREKTTGKKIDDLISEIRADREQRHAQLENLIQEIRQERNERNKPKQ